MLLAAGLLTMINGSGVELCNYFYMHEGLASSDLFIRTRTGFRVPLWYGFQFVNEIQVDYFSKPAPGKERFDTRYLFNIGYRF